ncbi:MAG: hypothetical protein NTZ09_17990 [Candidatus Hydrogenedentes bacterium]|nr:hypothetical protein [Candidatus Hydrogenedentota bacterium]
MDAVQEHLREHYKLYIGIFLVLLPPVVFFRRYSIPAILYTIEFAVYCALMHSILGGVVRLASWFKAESAMKRAFDAAADSNPHWITPFRYFYDRTQYHPAWLFYLEIVAVVAILVLMYKWRPLRAQKKSLRPLTRRTLARKMSAQAAKPPSTWSNRR